MATKRNTKKKTPELVLTDADSRSGPRLATARAEKIAAFLEGKGIEVSPKATRRSLIKTAREHGWGFKGNVVNKAKKAEYGAAQTCGDDLAEVFARCTKTVIEGKEVLDMDKLSDVAAQNGLTLDPWSHLGPGQQRMNLGNVLRGMIRRLEPVTVGDPATTGKSWNVEKKARKNKAA